MLFRSVFTVSGVMVCFRRAALHNVGYWNPHALTEDIDISWRLQMHHWDVRFEPAALCWILMPETFRGLWRQRLRWSMGGSQVLFGQLGFFRKWQHRRMLPVYIEYFTSVIWAYTMAAMILLWVAGQLITLPPALSVNTLIPGWNGLDRKSTRLNSSH